MLFDIWIRLIIDCPVSLSFLTVCCTALHYASELFKLRDDLQLGFVQFLLE